MAQKTIPQLNEITEIDENAIIPVDTGIQSYKISAPNLAESLAKFGPRYRGKLSAGVTYKAGDVVYHVFSYNTTNTNAPRLYQFAVDTTVSNVITTLNTIGALIPITPPLQFTTNSQDWETTTNATLDVPPNSAITEVKATYLAANADVRTSCYMEAGTYRMELTFADERQFLIQVNEREGSQNFTYDSKNGTNFVPFRVRESGVVRINVRVNGGTFPSTIRIKNVIRIGGDVRSPGALAWEEMTAPQIATSYISVSDIVGPIDGVYYYAVTGVSKSGVVTNVPITFHRIYKDKTIEQIGSITISGSSSWGARDIRWSPNGEYLALFRSNKESSANYLWIYKRSGSTMSTVGSYAVAGVTDIGAGEGAYSAMDDIAWSDDSNFLAIRYPESPYLKIMSRRGDTFTDVSPNTAPPAPGGVYRMRWVGSQLYFNGFIYRMHATSGKFSSFGTFAPQDALILDKQVPILSDWNLMGQTFVGSDGVSMYRTGATTNVNNLVSTSVISWCPVGFAWKFTSGYGFQIRDKYGLILGSKTLSAGVYNRMRFTSDMAFMTIHADGNGITHVLHALAGV